MEQYSGSTTKADAPGIQFAFVIDETQRSLRSHAMREHWKERRHIKQSQSLPGPSPASRSLQPRPPSQISPTIAQSRQSQSSRGGAAGLSSAYHPDPEVRPELLGPKGIPAQALFGMNRAISCGRVDPFDSFPVELKAEHHKLIHHWLSTYAVMVFDGGNEHTFNPMLDVWFPLDLSNAASFNAIMAHSAAHLSMMQGKKHSSEALWFKTEAIRIITEWMTESAESPGDEILAAVVRLLTYERYWGTEAEWRVHHQGLVSMTLARGGIAALQENWRLQLVIYLIFLMSNPSWFDSTNQIDNISHTANSTLVLGSAQNLHMIRSLWLLSFVQDMRIFMGRLHKLYAAGYSHLSVVRDAVLLLQRNVPQHVAHLPQQQQQESDSDPDEAIRLACLFFVCVVLQTTQQPDSDVSSPLEDSNLLHRPVIPDQGLPNILNIFLGETGESWRGSVQDLHGLLFQRFVDSPEKAQIATYTTRMASVLTSMSEEARRGVEFCLLQILSVQFCGDSETSVCTRDETPDSLLSSLHGF